METSLDKNTRTLKPKRWLTNIWKNVMNDEYVNPFTLEKLTEALLDNQDKFLPVEPTFEVLATLYGQNPPYILEKINSDLYRERVSRWIVDKGIHVYSFKKEGTEELTPLAFIRIDESIPHAPNSHLDRITNAYYFDDETNGEFTKWLHSIHNRRVHYHPLGNRMTDNSIELLLTCISL